MFQKDVYYWRQFYFLNISAYQNENPIYVCPKSGEGFIESELLLCMNVSGSSKESKRSRPGSSRGSSGGKSTKAEKSSQGSLSLSSSTSQLKTSRSSSLTIGC